MEGLAAHEEFPEQVAEEVSLDVWHPAGKQNVFSPYFIPYILTDAVCETLRLGEFAADYIIAVSVKSRQAHIGVGHGCGKQTVNVPAFPFHESYGLFSCHAHVVTVGASHVDVCVGRKRVCLQMQEKCPDQVGKIPSIYRKYYSQPFRRLERIMEMMLDDSIGHVGHLFPCSLCQLSGQPERVAAS